MAKAKRKPEESKRNSKSDRPIASTVADQAAAETAAAQEINVQEPVAEAPESFTQDAAAPESSEARNICELSFSLGAASAEGGGVVDWYQPEISDTIKKVVSAGKTLVRSIGPSLAIKFRIEDNEVRLRVIECNSQRDFSFQGGTFPGSEIQAAPQAIAKIIRDAFSGITNESAESLEKMIAEGKIKGAVVDFARAISKENTGIKVKDGDSEIDIQVPAKEKIPMRAKPTARMPCITNGTITAKGNNGEYFLDGGEVRFESEKNFEIGDTVRMSGVIFSNAREMKVAESFENIEVLLQLV